MCTEIFHMRFDSPTVPVEDILGDLECVNGNMSVYDKRYLPRRLHYVYNQRIDDIPVYMADGIELKE